MSCRFFSFQHLLHIWTLSSSDCMILRSIFSHWGTQTQLLKRFKHSVMLQKNTRCFKSRGVKTFEQDEDVQIFLILLKYLFFFPFSAALQKQQKMLACFPEDKLSTIYLDLQIQKVFTPRLLMHCVFFWSISECLTLFNSCVWVPQLSSVWKDEWWTYSCHHVFVECPVSQWWHCPEVPSSKCDNSTTSDPNDSEESRSCTKNNKNVTIQHVNKCGHLLKSPRTDIAF